ncbi:ArsR/SmtB family transcription factor [Paenibacillus sp. HW567]|uniref:ArsR/SmtB family transcription factor n=1 Tax=Paenibacillus sp. HW567 TaxID=1034769 RepID=UPI00036C5EF4|nr:ArsR family transcriptional regulator [Paenibacillus sp. HW567]
MKSKKRDSFMQYGYSEPLEFIAYLIAVSKMEHVWMIRDLKFTPDAEVVEMINTVDSRLSRFVKGEMERFFGKGMTYDRLDAVLNQAFFDEEEPKSVEIFLEYYNRRPAEELVVVLALAAYADVGADWIKEHDFIQNTELLYQLVVAHPLPDLDFHSDLLEYLRFPEEFKQRTLYVLKSFLSNGFMQIRDRLQQLGKENATRYEKYFNEKPELAFGDLAKMDEGLIIKPTRIHISYISQVQMDFRRSETDTRPDWLILGARNDALVWQREEKETIEKFLKVVSDKRRLEMIELLKERQRYAGELANLIGLTPAAINYHTNLLIDLNLIRIIRSDNRIYYELSKERLTYLIDQTRSVLLR